MNALRCKACRWFDQQHKSIADLLPDYGYCRKHKPMIIQVERRFFGSFPILHVDDYCGEFRAIEQG